MLISQIGDQQIAASIFQAAQANIREPIDMAGVPVDAVGLNVESMMAAQEAARIKKDDKSKDDDISVDTALLYAHVIALGVYHRDSNERVFDRSPDTINQLVALPWEVANTVFETIQRLTGMTDKEGEPTMALDEAVEAEGKDSPSMED